jgi:hypothetical protein
MGLKKLKRELQEKKLTLVRECPKCNGDIVLRVPRSLIDARCPICGKWFSVYHKRIY